MRAAVMHGRQDIRIEEVADPHAGAGELVLEVHAAGVCGTDAAEFFQGPAMFPIPGPHALTGHAGPMILGHEFGGRVVAVGDGVTGFSEGSLVASGAGVSCGVCYQCRTGRTNLCIDYWTVGLQRHGGLAQYAAVPAAACLDVGDLGLTDEEAALVQPMSIAVHSMRRGRPEHGEDALVIGVGGIGAFLVHALASSGHRVIAVDLDERRLGIAASLGAWETVVGGSAAAEQLASMSPHPRVAYETSGSAAGLDLAMAATPPGSRIVAVGLQHAPTELDLKSLTLQERELIGTNAHSFAADFLIAAEMVAGRTQGWSDVAPTVLPLDELVPTALQGMRAGGSERIKTLLDPWSTDPRPLDTARH